MYIHDGCSRNPCWLRVTYGCPYVCCNLPYSSYFTSPPFFQNWFEGNSKPDPSRPIAGETMVATVDFSFTPSTPHFCWLLYHVIPCSSTMFDSRKHILIVRILLEYVEILWSWSRPLHACVDLKIGYLVKVGCLSSLSRNCTTVC